MTHNAMKQRAALISVGSNTLLVLSKLLIGYKVGSVSIVSEAIHSAVDLLAAVIAYAAVRAAAKPPDGEHPYGHGKIENLSGAIEAALIGVAGLWIIFEAAERFLHPQPIEQPHWGLVVMALSAVVNILVSRYLFRVAKATHSVALEADAWHLRTDVWTSVGIVAGFSVVTLMHYFAPQYRVDFIDPGCAIAVAFLILKAAWDLTRDSLGDLLDQAVPEWEADDLMALLRKHPSVLGAHGLRTRKNGRHRFVEVHLVVHPETTVLQAHQLEHELLGQLRQLWEETLLLAHVEPCDLRCPLRCQEGCWVGPRPSAGQPFPPRRRVI